MGTYRQPSQIIDKRFNTLNQGLQNASQAMVNGLREIRAQEIAMAKEAKKEQEKRDKERKAFEAKRNAAVDGYRVKIDNWEHINQKRTEDWQAEDVAIENQLKNNALYYLDIMSESTEGDDNYRTAKRAIENMITQYPVFAQLLNDNAEEVSSAYGSDGNLISSNSVGALIKTNDPLYKIKRSMLKDLKDGANPDRFQIIAAPSGIDLIYTNDEGEEFDLNAVAYQDYVSGGNDLMKVTDEKSYNVFLDNTWDTLGKDYGIIEKAITSYRDPNNKNREITEVEESYIKANNKLKANINNYIENKNPITQNQWQLLGGEDVYDANDSNDKERAKELLYKDLINRYGKQDRYQLTTEEIIKSRGRGAEDEVETVDYSSIISNKDKLLSLLKNPNQVIDPKVRKEREKMSKEELAKLPLEEFSTQEKELVDILKNQIVKQFEAQAISGLPGGKTGIVDVDINVGKDSSGVTVIKFIPKQQNKDGEIVPIPAFGAGITLDENGLLKLDKEFGLDKKVVLDSTSKLSPEDLIKKYSN
jgi:hypothetical protein